MYRWERKINTLQHCGNLYQQKNVLILVFFLFFFCFFFFNDREPQIICKRTKKNLVNSLVNQKFFGVFLRQKKNLPYFCNEGIENDISQFYKMLDSFFFLFFTR